MSGRQGKKDHGSSHGRRSAAHGDSDNHPTKKSKQHYYHYQQQRKKKNQYQRNPTIEAGMRGFLVAPSNAREENKCTKECYNLLNEALEELQHGTPTNSSGAEEVNDEPSQGSKGEGSLTIEEQLQNELEGFKEEKNAPRIFNKASTGCRGLCFIAYEAPESGDGPSVRALAGHIYNRALTVDGGISRHIQRFLPVQEVVAARIEAIVEAVKRLIEGTAIAPERPSATFKIQCKRRFHDGVTREDMIHGIGTMLSDVCPQHRANMKEPDAVIVVEVIKSVALVSVVEDYVRNRRYNLYETQRQKDAQHTETAANCGDDAQGSKSEAIKND